MKITDEMLSQAAGEVMDAMMKSLPDPDDCHHEFSPEFERKMEKLIRKTRHYTVYKVLNRVACILLIIALAGGSVLTFNAEAREAFFGWVHTRFEEFYQYFFEWDKEAENPDELKKPEEREEYAIGWVPEGYTFVRSFDWKNGKEYVYANNAGDMMRFVYLHGIVDTSKANSLFMFNGEYEIKREKLKNGIADVYFASNAANSNVIVWADVQNEVIFAVFGYLDEPELVKVAENLKSE